MKENDASIWLECGRCCGSGLITVPIYQGLPEIVTDGPIPASQLEIRTERVACPDCDGKGWK